jgi:hypothetical protein
LAGTISAGNRQHLTLAAGQAFGFGALQEFQLGEQRKDIVHRRAPGRIASRRLSKTVRLGNSRRPSGTREKPRWLIS